MPFSGNSNFLLPPPDTLPSISSTPTPNPTPTPTTPPPATLDEQKTMTRIPPSTPPTEFFNSAERWTARDEQNYVAQSILLALFPGLNFIS